MPRNIPNVGHISVIYDGEDPKSYRGVEYSTKAAPGTHVINSGNPKVDYVCAMLVLDSMKADPVMGSSSIDHFTMDGGDLNTDTLTKKEKSAIRSWLDQHKQQATCRRRR